MNTFYYKATDRLGKPIEGNLEAHDYQNAVAQLRGLDRKSTRLNSSHT